MDKNFAAENWISFQTFAHESLLLISASHRGIHIICERCCTSAPSGNRETAVIRRKKRTAAVVAAATINRQGNQLQRRGTDGNDGKMVTEIVMMELRAGSSVVQSVPGIAGPFGCMRREWTVCRVPDVRRMLTLYGGMADWCWIPEKGV